MASRHSHTALPRQATELRLVVFFKAKRGTAVSPRDRCRARQQNGACFHSIKQSTPAEFFRWRSLSFPDGHTLFPQEDTTSKGKERNGSSVTLVRWRSLSFPRAATLSFPRKTQPAKAKRGTAAPPGARKGSGKNLVFPRGPEAASPTGLMVISALRRNNTPPMPEIPFWDFRQPSPQ